MKKKLIHLPLAAFLLLSMIGLTSCGEKGEQPELPPESALVMGGFSDFEDAEGKTFGIDTTQGNFIHAGLNVLVWNVVITLNAVVPVTAYANSFNYTPKWNRRLERWVWSYDVTVGFKTYQIDLHGWIANSRANWEMHISERNGVDDFVWFTGYSELDQSSGGWTLNRSLGVSEPYIDILWNSDQVATADIKYTNVIPGDAGNGGYIQYGTDTDTDFDRWYHIYNIQNTNLTEIEWNFTSKDGRVKDPAHFGDSDWHCWTGTVWEDVICN